MQQGYIKLYRCMIDKPWSRHPEYVALWVYCLMRANYHESDIVTRTGTHVHLNPGQFVSSREQISINTGIQESKVERILKVFKSEQQIEQQNCGKFRIISILNWSKFQQNEQQNEQQVNNRRTTGEQQVNTDKKVKEGKEYKRFIPPSVSDVETYMQEIGYKGDAQNFVDSNSAKGWVIGKLKTPAKDWKAMVRTWHGNEKKRNPEQVQLPITPDPLAAKRRALMDKYEY